MNCSSFINFTQAKVIPSRKKCPSHIRLDGQKTGGNRTEFGRFEYNGCTWKVHSDTHYKPLLLAYSAAIEGSDPFRVVSTEKGKRSLKLKQELKERQKTRYDYLYIYQV